MMDFFIYDLGVDQVHDSSTFRTDRPHGLGKWLFLLIKSHAVFYINGVKHITDPGTAVLFSPDNPQNYTGLIGEEYYQDDWMEFDMSRAFINKYGIPTSTLLTGFDIKSIDMIFRIMLQEHYFGGEKKEYYCRKYFSIILEKLSDSVNKTHNRYYEFEKLRNEISADPGLNWNAADVSAALGFSQSHFQNVYRTVFGTAFAADVLNMRIKKAEILLETTDLSINDISTQCGFNSVSYFTRQFKSKNDVTPSRYRGS